MILLIILDLLRMVGGPPSSRDLTNSASGTDGGDIYNKNDRFREIKRVFIM